MDQQNDRHQLDPAADSGVAQQILPRGHPADQEGDQQHLKGEQKDLHPAAVLGLLGRELPGAGLSLAEGEPLPALRRGSSSGGTHRSDLTQFLPTPGHARLACLGSQGQTLLPYCRRKRPFCPREAKPETAQITAFKPQALSIKGLKNSGGSALVALVGLDDAGHQGVSDDICRLQLNPGNPLHRAQDPSGMEEARRLPLGQVELRRIPGDDDARPCTHPGEEHLHLGRGRVLGLIKNDKGIVEGATTHVGEGHHLDDFPVAVATDLIVIEHLVKGVIERAQVRVDLLLEITGKKAEFFPRFYRRAAEDQLANFTRLEGFDSSLDCEIGFSRSCRAQ